MTYFPHNCCRIDWYIYLVKKKSLFWSFRCESWAKSSESNFKIVLFMARLILKLHTIILIITYYYLLLLLENRIFFFQSKFFFLSNWKDSPKLLGYDERGLEPLDYFWRTILLNSKLKRLSLWSFHSQINSFLKGSHYRHLIKCQSNSFLRLYLVVKWSRDWSISGANFVIASRCKFEFNLFEFFIVLH